MPFGELLDMVSCYQIRFAGAVEKTNFNDEMMIPDIP